MMVDQLATVVVALLTYVSGWSGEERSRMWLVEGGRPMWGQRRGKREVVGSRVVHAGREEMGRGPQQIRFHGSRFGGVALLLVVVNFPRHSHVHRVPFTSFLRKT